jgi:hypothetical protein
MEIRVVAFVLLIAIRAVAADKPVPDQRQSIDYESAEIRSVLRGVAEKYDVPVIIPDSLRGLATIKLRQVTWQEAFKKILEPIGWTYTWDGSVAVIEPKKSKSGDHDVPSEELLSALTAFQSGATKQLLRDADYSEALAEFYWNLYSALLRRGFTKEQAMQLVTSVHGVEAKQN